MARLTVDEEVWQDILSIAVKMRISKHLVSGPLFDLWHNSQRKKITHVSDDQFYDLCEIEEEEDSYKEKILKHFIKKGFLVPEERDSALYYIRGNQKHIDGIEAKRINGRKGGRPKKKEVTENQASESVKPESIKSNQFGQSENQDEELENLEKPIENQSDKLGLPIHYNSIQTNTLHFNSKQQAPPSGAPPQIKTKELIELWNSKAPPKKKFKSFFLSAKHQKALQETLGFSEFQARSQWAEIFDIAFADPWLSTQGPLSLSWIVQHHNADDVLNGKYTKSVEASEKENSTDSIDWSFAEGGSDGV